MSTYESVHEINPNNRHAAFLCTVEFDLSWLGKLIMSTCMLICFTYWMFCFFRRRLVLAILQWAHLRFRRLFRLCSFVWTYANRLICIFFSFFYGLAFLLSFDRREYSLFTPVCVSPDLVRLSSISHTPNVSWYFEFFLLYSRLGLAVP